LEGSTFDELFGHSVSSALLEGGPQLEIVELQVEQAPTLFPVDLCQSSIEVEFAVIFDLSGECDLQG
jgi:hypothetical protein